MAVRKVVDIETPDVLNGLDLGAVRDSLKALEENPELGSFRFRLRNRWVNGGHNQSTIKDYYGLKQDLTHNTEFRLDADEPEVLAGTDKGANPVEHLLNALAACMTTTLVYHAALRNIRLEEVESELEGDIDIRGFLGLARDVRNGYEGIRVKFRVKTDEENIDRLKALSKMSPVFDVTTHGTRVDVEIERKEAA